MEVIQNQEGSYNILLKSKAGNTLFKSVSYENEVNALQFVGEMKTNAIFDRQTNTEGDFIIVLKTKEGQVIGQSNVYTSEVGMENGIKNLRNILANNLI